MPSYTLLRKTSTFVRIQKNVNNISVDAVQAIQTSKKYANRYIFAW